MLAEHGSGSSGLFTVLLVLVCGSLAALPVVRVPVGLTGEGIIRPELEKHEIRTARGGVVEEMFAREGMLLAPGAVIARIRIAGARERGVALAAERARLLADSADLERLLQVDPGTPLPSISTARHRAARDRYLSVLRRRQERIHRMQREMSRVRALVDRQVYPRARLEDAAFGLEQERRIAETERAEARATWQAELAAVRSDLDRVRAEEAQIRAELALSVITAPVRGTLEQVVPAAPGSMLQPGDLVAVLSPDTSLVAVGSVEAGIAARVGPGSPVRLEIDAFPASEWGVATGSVRRISADAVPGEAGPRYAVVIDLHTDALRHRDGRRGTLRKGMAFRARFAPTTRTLWQLLRDGAADRLDPTGGGG